MTFDKHCSNVLKADLHAQSLYLLATLALQLTEFLIIQLFFVLLWMKRHYVVWKIVFNGNEQWIFMEAPSVQEQTLKCYLHRGHSVPLHSRRCITVGIHKYSSALICSLPASTSTLLLLSQMSKCESPHSSLPISLSQLTSFFDAPEWQIFIWDSIFTLKFKSHFPSKWVTKTKIMLTIWSFFWSQQGTPAHGTLCC